MTESPFRVFAAFLGLSFRADHRGAWGTLLMFILRPFTAIGFALGLAVMTADLLDGDYPTAIAAACAACVLLVAQVASGSISLSISGRMVDRTGRLVDREVQQMLYGAPTLEHLHDPDVLDKLEVIRAERPRLTEGADVTGLITGTLLRLVCVTVIAVLATPWLLLVPVGALISYFCTIRAERARHKGQDAAAEAARLQQEYFAIGTDGVYQDELLISGGWRFARDQHVAWGQRAERARSRGIGIGLAWSTLSVLIMTAAFGAGFYPLVSSLRAGTTSVSAGLAAILLLSNVTVQISALMRYLSALSDSLRATRILMQVRFALTPDKLRSQIEHSQHSDQKLVLRSVSYRYPAGDSPAIGPVDLTLRPGTVYALVGENGSGKSTLVHVLAGMLRPTRGHMRPDADMTTSLVAQDFARLEFPLQDAIRLGDIRPDAAGFTAAMAGSGLDTYLDKGELSPQTPLGTSLPGGRELSGGQWQRVAIGRGLFRSDAVLLLLDEPTSAIDPLAENELLTVFAHWAHRVVEAVGGVAVIVTHRMSLAKEVDQVILMKDGQILAVAPHDELLSVPEYERLYGTQQRAYIGAPSDDGAGS